MAVHPVKTVCREGENCLKKYTNLTLKVYTQIIEFMLNYEIIPGQRLFFEDLAERLEVSRTPVNNALSILAQEGYLDFVPNQGYSVHKLTKTEAENLYHIRDVLEVGFIGSAIRSLNEEKRKKIERCKLYYEEAISNRVNRKLFILDAEFHASILDMAGNTVLSAKYREINQKIFFRFRTEDLLMGRIMEIKKEHSDIYEAVCLKDVERSKEQVLSHHNNSRRSLFPLIFPEV